jgi:hypothetical protein
VAAIKGGNSLVTKLRGMASKAAKSPTLSVGFMSGATYPDGTPVPLVAAVNEFGNPAKGQPPRPFFRRMIAEKKDTWPNALGKQLKATDYDIPKTLDRMGQGIAGQLKTAIRDLTDPPLAASTIKAKGFPAPLIETGHMLNSVDYKVEG